MPSLTRTVVASAMLAFASAQGVITAAKGDKGTSLALQVDPANAQDANFISQSEITGNVVNGCGRTFALGNIDIGEQTENQLIAGTVTQVSKGSDVTVTISQRNANGTGPFICDMDQSSNAGENRPLSVTQGNAGTGTGDLTIKVAMPSDLACVGASTGNICTVRCVNSNNFGGCFAVQQSDIKAAVNTPNNIPTAQKLDQILQQVEQNKQDLDTAVKAQGSATNTDIQNQEVAGAILAADPGIEALPPALTLTTAAAAAATSAAAGTGKKGNGKGATNNAGNAKGNGNAAATTGNAKGNNKRDGDSLLRWAKRFVVSGVDWTGEDN
ncbi:hypothetical protein GQ53DRAFT_355714 [Thozetella sp. PMI_491]|nr:hypothetical protein GQ53DRAFT_355714 [Thozetella sp. PMI_491]